MSKKRVSKVIVNVKIDRTEAGMRGGGLSKKGKMRHGGF